MKRIYSFLFASAATLMLVGCDKAQDKPEPTPPTPPTPKTEVTTHTVTPQGGNFDYKGDIKLVIPKDGVKENTQIEAKYSAGAGNFDYQGMFEPLGKGIEITLKPETLKKGFEIEFPAPEGFDPETTVAIQYVQGQSEGRATTAKSTKSEQVFAHKLIPVGRNRLRLQVDTIARANNSKITENVFTIVKDKRVVPLGDRGLRLISFPKENMVFNELGDLSNKRCLVLIHGWTSNPKNCWSKFVKHTGLDKLKTDYNYDAILTFGYYTGNKIDKNGEFLADRIKLYLSNSTVDIVAHSMGGLVARSAIENHGAEPYVRTLITLGTPHLGSGWSGFSPVMSYIKNLDKEGGKDLAKDSEIIKKLASNLEPSTNYYFIAGRRDDDNDEEDKDGDGLVSLESATNNWTDENKIKVFNYSDWAVFPHTELTDDSRIINHTLEKLREFANTETLRNTILEDDFSGQNLDLQKWDSKSDRIRVDNGILKMEQNITDEAVDLQTRQMFKAEKWVKLSRRVYIYHSNSQSYPFVTFEFPKIQERVALHYANYAYENLYGVICSHGNIKTDWHSIRRPFYVSEKLGECITNSWFNEEIYISFQDKKIVYTRDGKVLREVLLPMLKNSVFSIKFNPYGWYTGHKHYMDDFKLEVR